MLLGAVGYLKLFQNLRKLLKFWMGGEGATGVAKSTGRAGGTGLLASTYYNVLFEILQCTIVYSSRYLNVL